MWSLDKVGRIVISSGDTMVLPVRFTGRKFTERDRVIFTVKDEATSARALIRKVLVPQNDTVCLELSSAESASLGLGRQRWDVRIVIDPVYNLDGEITGGATVITPFEPKEIRVMEVVGDVQPGHCN